MLYEVITPASPGRVPGRGPARGGQRRVRRPGAQGAAVRRITSYNVCYTKLLRIDYPYGCNEQLCSRLLPLVVFGDYAEAFGLTSRVGAPRAVAERVLADIASTQRPDGGFGLWAWSVESIPYVSLRVAQA